MTPDPRIDAILAKAQPFAQPLLTHIRALMHSLCPDGVETPKWSAMAFTYKDVIVAMASPHKSHINFGFWYGDLVTEGTGFKYGGMGSFGKIKSLADLPNDADLARMIATSIRLIDQGVKPPQFEKPQVAPKPEASVPAELAQAVAVDPAAQAAWDAFPPGARREYCEWIADAKQVATRDKRVTQAAEWIAQGKKRNWKYEAC